jgi:hypothetical protein
LWEPGLHLYYCRSIYFCAQGFFFRLATSRSFSPAKTSAGALVHFLIELFAITGRITPLGLRSVRRPCLILDLSIKSFSLCSCSVLVQFLFVDVLLVPLERAPASLCLVAWLPSYPHAWSSVSSPVHSLVGLHPASSLVAGARLSTAEGFVCVA